MFSPAIIKATKYESLFTKFEFTKTPIFNFEDVKFTKGKTAKLNCIDNMT